MSDEIESLENEVESLKGDIAMMMQRQMSQGRRLFDLDDSILTLQMLSLSPKCIRSRLNFLDVCKRNYMRNKEDLVGSKVVPEDNLESSEETSKGGD